MPMPDLDPSRFVEAVLADPTHKLPLPDRGYRLFGVGGEMIDLHNPFYAGLIADGSLVVKPVAVDDKGEAQAEDKAANPKPEAGPDSRPPATAKPDRTVPRAPIPLPATAASEAS